MTDIIEAVARALDPCAFKQQAKYDKYNGDNPAVERDAALWDCAVADALAHAKDMLAAAEPLITGRAQEAVLRELAAFVSPFGYDGAAIDLVERFAREHGIDLTKDADNG